MQDAALINPFIFWAKLPREEHPPTKFHPLLCHMMDVAAVAETLWQEILPDEARARFAANLRLDVKAAGAWMAFLAGLHDLGKLCPAFQFIDAANVLFKGKGALLFDFYESTQCEAETWHQWVTAVEMPNILTQQPFNVDRKFAERLGEILGGHHGEFPQSDSLRNLKKKENELPEYSHNWNACLGGERWHRLRVEATQILREVLKLPCDYAPCGADTHSERNTFAMMFSGFVSVSDWIGSDAEHFQFAVTNIKEPPKDKPHEYMNEARQHARKALELLGWRGIAKETRRTESFDFAEMFAYLAEGKVFEPNEAQKSVKAIAEQIAAPCLVILEAPMGLGKTEAAIYLAERWRTTRKGNGYYFALPTQATSDQMYGRILRFLTHRFPNKDINFQLLHGYASLAAELRVRQKRKEKGKPETIKMTPVYGGGIAAEEWFMRRKRGLLAPFGVGTVDQVLLAALKTRHVFVRLFGLAGKTIIVDEVHAYDAYMTTLLERLLEWLAALDCSVVLLSATLPEAKRRALINAYRKGRGIEAKAEPPDVKYPRVTWTTGETTKAEPISVAPAEESNGMTFPPRALRIEWRDGGLPTPESGEPFSLGDELQRKLAAGGCAAVICNTVDRAQKMYTQLKKQFKRNAQTQNLPVPRVYLFHARYLFKDRERIKKMVLRRFGKLGDTVDFNDGCKLKVKRPRRTVLIATQVIEQSLDLDFDLMVSDFAPVDLLLQRSGRIHRHKGNPRYELKQPTLWLCRAEMRDGMPRFDAGTEAVYSLHILWRRSYKRREDDDAAKLGSYILLRSWLALSGGLWDAGEVKAVEISIPRDIETLIEAAYREDAAPPANSTEQQREFWNESKKNFDECLEEQRREAEIRALKEPKRRSPLSDFTKHAREEDAPEIHAAHQALTRLGESIDVVCLYGKQDSPTFDIAGAERIDPHRKPTDEETDRLLRHSLSLSLRGLIECLRDESTPSGWKKSPLLRHHRLIALDEPPAGYRFTLEPALGLVIERTERKNER